MLRRCVALAPIAVLAACGAEPRPVLLSDLPGYAGPLRITWSGGGGAERVLAGELVFDRATAEFSFVRESDGRELRRRGGGPLLAFAGAEPVEATLADEGDFALLMLVLGSEPPEGEIRTTAGGYAFEQGDQRLAVSFTLPGSPAAPAESR